MFGRNSLDKIEVSTLESEIRSEEEGMHHFRVDKNAELVLLCLSLDSVFDQFVVVLIFVLAKSLGLLCPAFVRYS